MDLLTEILSTRPSYRPLPGQCIVELDAPLSLTPSGLHIPESARGLKLVNKDALTTGTIVLSTHRDSDYTRHFHPGDRVVVALRLEDLEKTLVSTHNTRIWALLEDGK